MVEQLHQLLNLVWTREEMPTDWKKGSEKERSETSKEMIYHSVASGEESLCYPFQEILTKIILERMKNDIDKELRDEQAGFRKERSCTDQIATVRVIVEQTLEWQTSLYVCFMDFEKAFDSVDQQSIWRILRHYSIPEKIVYIIGLLYEELTCQVIHDGRLSDEFAVTTGVRQGCLLLPLLFKHMPAL